MGGDATPRTRKNVGSGKSRSSRPHPSDPQAALKSWRDVLPIHPAADLFPLMAPDELKALGEDIVKNGLTSAIVLWRATPKGRLQLLDGRNQLDAIEIATGKPAFGAGINFFACDLFTVMRKSVDPVAYVISANIHRRHLTAEQKRDLIAKLLKATPEKSIGRSPRQPRPITRPSHRSERSKRHVGKFPTSRPATDSKGRQQPARKPSERESRGRNCRV